MFKNYFSFYYNKYLEKINFVLHYFPLIIIVIIILILFILYLYGLVKLFSKSKCYAIDKNSEISRFSENPSSPYFYTLTNNPVYDPLSSIDPLYDKALGKNVESAASVLTADKPHVADTLDCFHELEASKTKIHPIINSKYLKLTRAGGYAEPVLGVDIIGFYNGGNLDLFIAYILTKYCSWINNFLIISFP